MTRVVLGMVCVALAACGTPAPVAEDASIVVDIPDTGPPDAGAPADAGDGTCGMSITINGWGQLPDSCLPRCTAATRAAVAACDTEACSQAARQADETPVVLVLTYAGPLGVSCAGTDTAYPCSAWQTYSCQADVCPDAYEAWARCRAEGAPCTDEEAALTTCSEASADFEPCLTTRLDACYAD